MTGPNLFLIAAPRSGSTQLSHWLASHPLIEMSPIKEPNFFAQHDFPEAYVRRTFLNDVDPARFARRRHGKRAHFAVFRDPAHYDALFRNLSAPWRFEASTSYLACPEAPRAIRARFPGAKAITLCRAPIDRAVSHYRLAQRTGRTGASLAQEVELERSGQVPPGACYLLRPSFQAEGLRRVAAAFGETDHLALRFEDLRDAPTETMARVARFLGIDDGAFDLRPGAQNAAASPRAPALNRLLYRTGLKTQIRRMLPPGVKQLIRPLFFDKTHLPPISRADMEHLAYALKDAA